MAHQEQDPKSGLILGIGIGSLVTIVGAMFILGSYYDVLRDKEQHDKIGARENPDLAALRKDEERKLGPNAYAVLDPNNPKARRVRIPIDRAITLLAQRGRDAIPSIQPDPAQQLIVVPGAPAPAASASAPAPAVSASAPVPPPSASAPPPRAPKNLTNHIPMKLRLVLTVIAAFALGSVGAHADPEDRAHAGLPADVVPPELMDVGVTERLGEQVPTDVQLRDETGKSVLVKDFVRGERPVVVNFVYHSCPTLCTFVQTGFAASVKEVPWTIGKDFDVLTISIDPKDTPEIASAKKAQWVKTYGRDEATTNRGWHFLTGDEREVKRLALSMGFTYHFDPRQQQFAHSAAIFVLTPTGKIARYLYGIEFPAKDVRLALAEAAEGRSISTVDHLLLYCYKYDPNARGYVVVAWRVMRVGSAFTIVVLGSFLGLMWRRDRKKQRQAEARSHDDKLPPSPPVHPGEPLSSSPSPHAQG